MSDKQSWSQFTEKELNYFRQQFDKPYSSTISYTHWLAQLGCFKSGASVLDLGCGMGEVSNHIAKAFPQTKIIGIEKNPQLVAEGNRYLQSRGLKNIRLEIGDLYQLEGRYGSIDGVFSTQTLSWMENAEKPLASFAKTKCRWIALSSLFYDGPVSAKIEVSDYSSQSGSREVRESYYNIYSMPRTIDFLKTLGFSKFEYKPFEIDIDLVQPADKGMGTHTLELKSGKRLQVSGPVWMSWYFLFAERTADGA